MIHGRNLIVALDGVAIAAAKTCSLDLDQNFLEACSPVSGRTHTKIPTTYNWGVSVDGLVADNSSPTVNLEDKLIAGTKCLLTFTDGSGNRRAGFVYVKSCKESGPVGGLATYSVSFESTGALYKYTEYTTADFAGTPNCTIAVNSSSVVAWSFSGSKRLKEVSISSAYFRKFYIVSSGAWAVLSSTSESDVRTYLSNQDTTSLNSKKYDAGNASKLIEPTSTNNFIFLTNNATKIYALS